MKKALKYFIYKKVESKLLPLKYPLEITKLIPLSVTTPRYVIKLTTNHNTLKFIYLKGFFHMDIIIYDAFRLCHNKIPVVSNPVEQLCFMIELLYRTK